MKLYSESCEQNKDPILVVLKRVFEQPGVVLEIGSGTGQHAAWLPAKLPHLKWQPSDRKENLPSIEAWRAESDLSNVEPVVELDVTQTPWPIENADYVFSANTAHIMSWQAVESFFEGIGRILKPGGHFCLYGPFNYNGQYTSVSNLRFDHWLQDRDPLSGIRDVADLRPLAETHGLALATDFEMPANNRVLHWQKPCPAA